MPSRARPRDRRLEGRTQKKTRGERGEGQWAGVVKRKKGCREQFPSPNPLQTGGGDVIWGQFPLHRGEGIQQKSTKKTNQKNLTRRACKRRVYVCLQGTKSSRHMQREKQTLGQKEMKKGEIITGIRQQKKKRLRNLHINIWGIVGGPKSD